MTNLPMSHALRSLENDLIVMLNRLIVAHDAGEVAKGEEAVREFIVNVGKSALTLDGVDALAALYKSAWGHTQHRWAIGELYRLWSPLKIDSEGTVS